MERREKKKTGGRRDRVEGREREGSREDKKEKRQERRNGREKMEME